QIEADITNAAMATGVSLTDKTSSVSVGAIISMNRTASLTSAQIVGSDSVTTTRGGVEVLAEDVSNIGSSITATSFTVATGNGGATSVSVAATFARNEVTSNALAQVVGTDVSAAGNIDVKAMRDARIDATGLSASMAIAAGANGTETSFSGGGAVAFNSVRGQARAQASSGTLSTSGNITVDAQSTSQITATVLSVAASVTFGTGTANAVAIGAVYVDNLLGYDQSAPDLSAETVFESSESVTRVQNGDYVRGVDGVAATGQIYRYIGTADRVELDDDDNVITNGVDLAIEDFADVNLWERVDLVKGTTPTAYASADNLISTPANLSDPTPARLDVTATSKQFINATVVGAAVALSGSTKNALAVAGGVAATRNRIAGGAQAEITGNSSDITAGAVKVEATEQSTISSLAAGASVGVAASGKSAVSIAVGIALAFNEVDSDAVARIVDGGVTATGSEGVAVLSTISPPTTYTADAVNSTVTAANLDDLATTDVDDSGADPVLDSGDASDTATGDGGLPGDKFIMSELVTLMNVKLGPDTLSTASEDLEEYSVSKGREGSWTLIDNTGRTFDLVFDNDGKLVFKTSTITAITAAASFAFGGGKAGIAIAAAGAYSQNVVLSSSSASIEGATITTDDDDGDVRVMASSAAAITSATLAASVAIGLGKTGVGVAIGASIAQNLIGSGAVGGPTPTLTTAFIKDSRVTAGGDVIVKAESAQLINALNVAGSVAVSGGKIGVSVAGSGVFVRNVIDVATIAKIEGDVGTLADGEYAISGDAVTVDAGTISKINAIAAAASVAFGFGKAAVSIAIGISAAQNEIGGATEASIVNLNDGGVLARSGNVDVLASDDARIASITAAAALSAAFGKVAVAVSAAGALAFNTIGSRVNATIDGSRVHTDVGDITVDAQTVGDVSALIASAAIAISGGAVGVGVGIGASFAHNLIGHKFGDDATTYRSSKTPTVNYGDIVTGTTVRVDSGINSGRAFKYIDDVAYGPNQDTDFDDDIDTNDAIALAEIDFNDAERWEEIDVDRDPVVVSATINNASIDAAGNLIVQAESTQTINTAALAIAAGIAAGKVGVGIGLSGAAVVNRIGVNAIATISGDLGEGILANTITVQADDNSRINAANIAGSISIGAGVVGVGVSLSAALAFNTVQNIVTATITDAPNVRATGADGNGDGVVVRAGSAADDLPVALNLATLEVANGAALAALLQDASTTETEDQGGDEVAVVADVADDNVILGNLKTALVLAGQEVAGVLRLSIVEDDERWVAVDEDGKGWNLTLNGNTITSNRATINAVSGAVSVALAIGKLGVAIAGAGASAVNVVLSNVDANITQSSVTTTAGDVNVSAESLSRINAAVLSTALAVGVGKVGVGVALGASFALNSIGKTQSGTVIANSGVTKASIVDSSINSVGGVEVLSTAQRDINALTFAGAASVAVGLVGVAVSGSGVAVKNVIAGSTEATITVGDGDVQGEFVTVSATDVSSIDAIAASVSLSIAAGKFGVGVSLGVSLAQNKISNATLAQVNVTDPA
ncbi:MAG: hypothetical protein HRU32_15725, partial [Rhodobacteraceae bacterium]|nr:hypothetical protein [Paracoccaceae bacterium]